MARHNDQGNAERQHRQPVEPRGDQIFDRMMAHRSGDIEIWIGVMQRVKAPEPRHCVLTPMHGVMQEIEQQKSHHKAQPLLGQGPRGQSHAKCAFKLRSECIQRSESEAGEDDV